MNTIKINGVAVKLLGEDNDFYYTEDIDKKFTLGLYSSRCAFYKDKDNNKIYHTQIKLNWWNPLVWLIEIFWLIFWFCKAFVMEGFYGVKELVEEYDKVDIFKYGSDYCSHHVPEGYTIEK